MIGFSFDIYKNAKFKYTSNFCISKMDKPLITKQSSGQAAYFGRYTPNFVRLDYVTKNRLY